MNEFDDFISHRPVHKKLPGFPELMLQDRVDDPSDYVFEKYEIEYDEEHVIYKTNEPAPRISKLIYTKKSTGEKYIIDMTTKKGR